MKSCKAPGWVEIKIEAAAPTSTAIIRIYQLTTKNSGLSFLTKIMIYGENLLAAKTGIIYFGIHVDKQTMGFHYLLANLSKFATCLVTPQRHDKSVAVSVVIPSGVRPNGR